MEDKEDNCSNISKSVVIEKDIDILGKMKSIIIKSIIFSLMNVVSR